MIPVPVGTGVLIAGGNFNSTDNNWIYDNWRYGVMQFWVPAPLRDEYDTSKLYDTSNGSRTFGNQMGFASDGTVLRHDVSSHGGTCLCTDRSRRSFSSQSAVRRTVAVDQDLVHLARRQVVDEQDHRLAAVQVADPAERLGDCGQVRAGHGRVGGASGHAELLGQGYGGRAAPAVVHQGHPFATQPLHRRFVRRGHQHPGRALEIAHRPSVPRLAGWRDPPTSVAFPSDTWTDHPSPSWE